MLKCAAFPDGIPEVILLGKNNHSKPLKNQKNNIIFMSLDTPPDINIVKR
jgi:hypothetical protein